MERGGLAVLEFDETTMMKAIRGLLNSHFKLKESKRKIELKYILPESGLWPLDDVTHSFLKLLCEKEKVILFLFVTLSQIMQHQRAQEKKLKEREFCRLRGTKSRHLRVDLLD